MENYAVVYCLRNSFNTRPVNGNLRHYNPCNDAQTQCMEQTTISQKHE